MSMSIDEKCAHCDASALAIARTIQEATDAYSVILFGSRARGDYRDDSDVDILLISEEQPSEETVREIEAIASRAQRETLPEAAGVELGWMTPAEFMRQRTKLNSLARELAKDGVPAMTEGSAKGHVQYVFDQDEEEGQIDWHDVQNHADAAMESARDLDLQVDADGFVKTSDRNHGYIAHRALESAYKAVLGSHGIEYPVSGRDGHDLGRLVELIKECVGSPIRGDYSYLTKLAGSGVAIREQRPLDKSALARAIPTAVRDAIALRRGPPDADC